MAGINFHYQDTSFKLPHPRLTSDWLKKVAAKEKSVFQSLDYIFCSDEYLLNINKEYLQHDDLTDVITFNYGDPSNLKAIEGEVYISLDRITENARLYNTDFDTELHRVIVHGALHLFGYSDKSASQKAVMREKEDAYLSLR
jgi:probable rRNA maturation factor